MLGVAVANSRGLTGQITKIVEAATAYDALALDLDFVDSRRVEREGSLDTNTVGGFPYGERSAIAALAAANADALEYLNTLFIALHDLGMDSYGVTRSKCREFDSGLFGFDFVD